MCAWTHTCVEMCMRTGCPYELIKVDALGLGGGLR